MPSSSEPTRPPSPTGPQFVVVSPTYNNGKTLETVLDGLRPLSLAIIVVNDGSRDNTREALGTWQVGDPKVRMVVGHAANRGKAASLLSGFDHARKLGFTHALTIDTDGQHAPGDLHALIAQAIAHPQSLIVGARPREMRGCPWTSRVGRYISNHLVWIASGVRVADSQSGLRCYPLDGVGQLGVVAGRFAYETEVIVRAGWGGVRVVEVPITGVYEVAAGRVTHFRVGRDSWDAALMHARLIGRSMLPGDPVPRACEGPADPCVGTILHRAWWWLGPHRLCAMARGDEQTRERLAASVATGFFMAAVPAYGIKTVACLWLAARFRLHPAVVIAVSSLSTPPLGIILLIPALIVGHLVLHGSMPTLQSLPTWSTFTFADVRVLLGEWLVGGIVFGAVLGFASYVLARLILRAVPRRDRRVNS